MLFPVLPIGGGVPVPILCVVYQQSPALSVDEAIRAAIQGNRRLAATVRDAAAARRGVSAAGALTNPNVVFTPALTGGVGGGSDTELLLQQPLEINGTRSARRSVASAQARRIDALTIAELRSVVFATRSAYFDLARAREQSVLTGTLLQTVEALDRIARRQVELGARPAIEQTQTGIEVTRARQQVALTTAAVTSAEAALNAVMNRPIDSPISSVALPVVDLTATATLPDQQEATRQALAQRTEIIAGEATADSFHNEARLARAEGIPDLSPQFRAGSVTRGVQQSGFGIGITLPLFDYGSRRGRVRQAEESARAEQDRVTATCIQIQQEVAQSLARLRATRDVLATYPQGLLEDATRLLRASRIGYEEGKTSVIQLIEAQRTYRQVQNDYLTAQVEYALALAELERATGAFPATALSTTSISTSVPSSGESGRKP